jgi:hypothetical protein
MLKFSCEKVILLTHACGLARLLKNTPYPLCLT